MPLSNTEIATQLDRLADLLEIQGENPFRVRAYRNAVRVISGHPQSIAELAATGHDLSDLPGIGSGIAEKIHTLLDSGHLPALEEAARETPMALADLMRVPGLGPQRVKQLYRELNVRSAADLEQAAAQGRIAELSGFGARTQARILEAVRGMTASEQRFGIAAAEDMGRALMQYLQGLDGVKKVVIAGSYRRRQETVGDLDILVTSRRGAPVMQRLREFGEIERVASQGTTRATVFLRSGLQVDVRVVPQVAFGAALYYFTGSKAHNVAVRRIAVGRGLKLNEYGLFRGDRRIAGRTEKELLAALDLPWIAPELRENRGEIEAARAGRLPRLVEVDDLRGDLHSHTTASDGHADLEAMAEAARRRGYEYLAITDHSQAVRIANGLDPSRLSRHLDAIARLDERGVGVRLLGSCEVDILEDGSLDLPDDLLQRLDVVVASVHSHFELSREKQTARLLRALDHPRVQILGHLSARRIGERDPIDLDVERVFEAAAERGCALEVNAQPERLDLSDVHCRLAKDMGVRLVISSDAHSTAGLDKIRFGVDQARRGWAEKSDVLNTRPLKEFLAALRQ